MKNPTQKNKGQRVKIHSTDHLDGAYGIIQDVNKTDTEAVVKLENNSVITIAVIKLELV